MHPSSKCYGEKNYYRIQTLHNIKKWGTLLKKELCSCFSPFGKAKDALVIKVLKLYATSHWDTTVALCILPRWRPLGLCGELVCVWGLRMDLSFVIRCIILVFLGTPEKTTLQREQGDWSLKSGDGKACVFRKHLLWI